MREPISQGKPVPSEVHVWLIPLHSTPRDVTGCLSEPEIARSARMPSGQKRAFTVSHFASRQILAGYLGVRASRVPLDSRYGRPPTVPGLMLSLSHSDDMALLAVSTGRVGIDLEPIANAYDEDLELLAQATLTNAELIAFRSTPRRARPMSWLRSWVRKEAALKAHGQGISDRVPSEVDVSPDQCDLALRNLDIGGEYIAALATEKPVEAPTIREWGHE